ncbi:MAG: hypothetical protein MJ062_01625 [Oscillospiraceae bacterium]|nr:hypothetical protein [Oscillospiraceae bacterium]
MLEEYPKKISREPLLTQEQRMKLSRENREKSGPAKKKSAPKKPKTNPVEEAKRAKRERQKKSAENRAKAARPKENPTETPLKPQTDRILPEVSQMQQTEKTVTPHKPVTMEITLKKKAIPERVSGKRYTNQMHPRVSRRRASSAKAVLLGICAMGLVGLVIYGRVQTNELYSEISKAQAKYDDTLAKNVSMHSEMEGKMTIKNVADYAENVLGLKQLDQYQIQYIQLQTEDEVVIAEEEAGFFVKIRERLVNFWEFIKGE